MIGKKVPRSFAIEWEVSEWIDETAKNNKVTPSLLVNRLLREIKEKIYLEGKHE